MADDAIWGGGLADAAAARRRLLEAERAEDRSRPGDEAELAERQQDAEGRRARRPGRPKGALNRKTKALEAWWRENGYLDPMELSAQWISADPLELQAWFIAHERAVKAQGKALLQACPSLLDIIQSQLDEAERVRPYLHGKKPVQVQVTDERLPALIVNLGTDQLAQGKALAEQLALSAGKLIEGEKANEINAADPASHGASSHDWRKTLKRKGD